MRLSGKTSEKCFPSASVISSRVYQQGLCRIKVKSAYIVFADIVEEAVVLTGIDRVKLIDLDKMKSSQRRLLIQEESVLLPDLPRLRLIPVIEQDTVST